METVTIGKLLDFDTVSVDWMKRNPNNSGSKLSYAIQKVSKMLPQWLKQFNDLGQQFNDELSDAKIDHCEVSDGTFRDPSGVVIPKGCLIYQVSRDARGNEVRDYIYTPAQRRALTKIQTGLSDKYIGLQNESKEKEIQINGCIITDVPEGLTQIELETFAGIIIPVDFKYPEKAAEQPAEDTK